MSRTRPFVQPKWNEMNFSSASSEHQQEVKEAPTLHEMQRGLCGPSLRLKDLRFLYASVVTR